MFFKTGAKKVGNLLGLFISLFLHKVNSSARDILNWDKIVGMDAWVSSKKKKKLGRAWELLMYFLNDLFCLRKCMIARGQTLSAGIAD